MFMGKTVTVSIVVTVHLHVQLPKIISIQPTPSNSSHPELNLSHYSCLTLHSRSSTSAPRLCGQ